MSEATEEKKIISPHLSPEDYLVLKQRASKSNMTLTDCLAYLINERSFSIHEITTHDMTSLMTELDETVNRASGYYNAMVKAGEISLDLGERIIKLYTKVDYILSTYYKELLSGREDNTRQEQERIEESFRTSQSNLPRDLSITTDRQKKQDVKCWVSQETYDTLIRKMDEAGYPREDKTRYLTDLINAKRFLLIGYYTDDLSKTNQLIYTATKPCAVFLRMFELQGFECAEQGREVRPRYEHILTLQKEIWHVIMNDRKGLYLKYLKKTRIMPKKQKGERRRTYKEKNHE